MDIMTSNLFSAISKEGARNIGKSAAMGVAAATVIFLACVSAHFGTPAYLSHPWIVTGSVTLISGGLGAAIMANGLHNEFKEKAKTTEISPPEMSRHAIGSIPRLTMANNAFEILANSKINLVLQRAKECGKSVEDVVEDIDQCLVGNAPETKNSGAKEEEQYRRSLQGLATLFSRNYRFDQSISDPYRNNLEQYLEKLLN